MRKCQKYVRVLPNDSRKDYEAVSAVRRLPNKIEEESWGWGVQGGGGRSTPSPHVGRNVENYEMGGWKEIM